MARRRGGWGGGFMADGFRLDGGYLWLRRNAEGRQTSGLRSGWTNAVTGAPPRRSAGQGSSLQISKGSSQEGDGRGLLAAAWGSPDGQGRRSNETPDTGHGGRAAGGGMDRVRRHGTAPFFHQ